MFCYVYFSHPWCCLPTYDGKEHKGFNMVTGLFSSSFRFRFGRRNSIRFLGLIWCAGLMIGCFISFDGGASFSSWMLAAEDLSVSIVSLFAVAFLPFLFSAFAVYCQQGWLIYFLAFFRSFSFGFCAAGIMCCFSSAGWLVVYLLFFTDFCLFPWLFAFWCKCLTGVLTNMKPELCCLAAIIFLVVSLDRCFITPFLASLI